MSGGSGAEVAAGLFRGQDATVAQTRFPPALIGNKETLGRSEKEAMEPDSRRGQLDSGVGVGVLQVSVTAEAMQRFTECPKVTVLEILSMGNLLSCTDFSRDLDRFISHG